MPGIRSQAVDRLFRAILNLKTIDECYDFFQDICTIKEIQDMTQRLEVAVLLDQGANYQAVSRDVNVSTATISRVSRCLHYGSGGYRTAIDRLKKREAPVESSDGGEGSAK